MCGVFWNLKAKKAEDSWRTNEMETCSGEENCAEWENGTEFGNSGLG